MGAGASSTRRTRTRTRPSTSTRGRTGADVEAPLQHVSGAMPVGAKQQGRRRRTGEWGRQGPLLPAARHPGAGAVQAWKRGSVMDPRRSLVSQGPQGPPRLQGSKGPGLAWFASVMPAHLPRATLPAGCAGPRRRLGRPRSHSNCPSKALEPIVTAARTSKRQGTRIAQHSPLLGHTRASLGGPIPAL